MESAGDQYGFDASFISEIPEYFQCLLCHLVLRDTVQILNCGHKFCEPCFKRLKTCSEYMNTPLCCPVDRNVIDLKDVFADKGMDRAVGGLKVKCTNSKAGCTWQGELRDLETHESKCHHRVLKKVCNEASIQDNRSLELLNELCQRMGKCEETLTEKEKDIAFLKFSLQEVKIQLGEKLVEVDMLKEENKLMKTELRLMKQQHQDLRQIETDIKNVVLKNVVLEEKFASLENQSLPSKELLDSNKLDVTVKDANHDDNFIEDLQRKVKKLEGHVTNIENILFLKSHGGSNDIVLEWRMQNYQYHHEIGEIVYSPVFFTQVKRGYCFQLRIRWSGEKKENLGIDVWLYHASNFREIQEIRELEPFDVPYSLEMLDENGNISSRKTILADIIKNRDECFSISPGKDHADWRFGFNTFLTMPELGNYIVNDSICIKCKLIPAY